jgi:hypothetical protein
MTIPNPGSDEALDAGCTCPVIDNNGGRGYYGRPDVFVYNLSCPIHGVIKVTPVDETADNLYHVLSEMANEAQKEGDYFG